jgi:hypothetical protein
VVVNGGSSSQTLFVDGQLVPPKVLSSWFGSGGGYSYATIRVAFDSRAMRDISIETGMTVAYLKFDPQDVVSASNDAAEPQITVVGDSYQIVRSENFGNSYGMALELGARLGIRNVATDAIGGTGYWNSGGDAGNLYDRVAAHGTDNSSIYVVIAGLNDYGDDTATGLVWPSRTTYENAVTGYLQKLRAAQPNAVIVVTGPFCPVPPMSDSTYVANSATNSSGMGDYLYKAQLHKSAIQQIAAPWIYLDVLMGGGWLNSSGATGDVTGLQWLTGGTAASGTSASNKPGNTQGGGGGGCGAISGIPIISGGSYQQAPDIVAVGGNGSGLLLASTLDTSGKMVAVDILTAGQGFTSAALPSIAIDPTYQLSPAILGAPSVQVVVNPGGQYPLPAFAPPGTPAWDLNNIYVMLGSDTVHPSVAGVEYFSTRLARNIYDAIMAL